MKYKKIALPFRINKSVLAFGAQSKSGFCFAKGNTAYLSDSAGDIGDFRNFKKFERSIVKAQREIKIKPEIIACDLHPEYISAKYAEEKVKSGIFGIKPEALTVKRIQHHEAHIASCIADNGIKGNVIGVAFDGAGFGQDGNIWGGEFFTGNLKELKRAAHLRYVMMPGGEAAVREPWRMGISYLYETCGSNMKLLRSHAPCDDSLNMLIQVLNKKINSPLTSSAGRLFDGVSSLIGLCDFAGYEGEAAIKLEKIIDNECRGIKGRYRFKYMREGGMTVIDWEPMIKSVIKDLEFGAQKPEISVKFHNAICCMIEDVCVILRKKYRIRKVCMSGGVFQNNYLKNYTRLLLEKDGFEVFLHKNVPAHDGSISLGQAVLAGV